MSAEDTVDVATSGATVPRRDDCKLCGQPMIYSIGDDGEPASMFCRNHKCLAWLTETPIP